MLDRTKGDVEALMRDMGARARAAARKLATATAERKHAALIGAAEALMRSREDVLNANAIDMANGAEAGLSKAMLDRLDLDNDRIRAIAGSLKAIADLPDPVGETIAEWDRPNGLHIERVRTPLGVVGVIFESRPNVTADAGALCLKAGNAVILRGGSDAAETNAAIHSCIVSGLESAGLPADAVQLVPTTDRAAVGEMLAGLDGNVDVIVPRGGRSLVERVQRDARVPVFAHLEGIVHVYIDGSADPDMAREIVANSKMRRTGICGAAETLLFDRAASHMVEPIVEALRAMRCEVRGTNEIAALADGIVAATDDDWSTEYLDAIVSARLVDGVGGGDRAYRPLVVLAHGMRDRAGCRRRRAVLRGGGQRHPVAQRVHPVRRWRRVRHGRGDRHRHRPDARARPRRRGAADELQVPRAGAGAGAGDLKPCSSRSRSSSSRSSPTR